MDVLLLLIFCVVSIQKVKTGVNVYTDGGWRPIIKSATYKNYDETSNTQNERQWQPPNTVDNVVLGDFIEIIDPPDVTKGLIANKKHLTTLDDNIQPVPIDTSARHSKVFKDGENYYTEYDVVTNKPDLKLLQRNSRKLNHDPIELLKNSINKNNNIHNKLFTKIEPKNKNVKLNSSYEVTEALDDERILATDHNPYFANTVIPNYDRIINPDNIKNNLTNNLFKILANYNIRSSDNLINYPLSLRQNSRNTNNRDFVYMRVPIKVPLKYNNANHLPVDPLLAVFLSNYGHYIPGYFGFSRNYENLYGYLASNNIHNNKPFGPYKLFSDADSSP